MAVGMTDLLMREAWRVRVPVLIFQAGEETEIAYSTPEGTLRFPVDTHAVRIESGDKKITAEARYALRQGESKLMETVLLMEFRFRP